MVHRRWDPGGGVVTGVAGARRHAGLMTGGNAAGEHVVVTGGAGRGGHNRMVHGRGPPGGGAVAAVAGDGRIGSALV